MGRPDDRQWLIVDMGITFGGDDEPGVDVILPDISFLEAERPNLLGLVLTHAHEDHFGAVVDLWPRLGGVPVYATPFTAAMLKSKLGEAGLLPGLSAACRSARERRFKSVRSTSSSSTCPIRSPSHRRSIIKTELGTVSPYRRLEARRDAVDQRADRRGAPRGAGRRGRHSRSSAIPPTPSATACRRREADVAVTLERLIAEAPRRVAVTIFASNVARIRSVANAARAAGRRLVVVGRAMYRVIEARARDRLSRS